MDEDCTIAFQLGFSPSPDLMIDGGSLALEHPGGGEHKGTYANSGNRCLPFMEMPDHIEKRFGKGVFIESGITKPARNSQRVEMFSLDIFEQPFGKDIEAECFL